MQRTVQQVSRCTSKGCCDNGDRQPEPVENSVDGNITGQHCLGKNCECLSWHNEKTITYPQK